MIKFINTQTEKASCSAIVEILLVFIIPVMLLYFGIIPLRYRFFVLIIFSLAIAFIALNERRALADLGIRKDNLKKNLVPYAIFTFAAMLGIIFIAYLSGRSVLAHWWAYPHFLFLFIPISFFQEFAYRAFLFPKLITLFRSATIAIFANALLFTLPHIIYPDLPLIIPLAFIGGIGFAYMYYRYPNLLLVSMSHMALNFIAVLYSFFSFYR